MKKNNFERILLYTLSIVTSIHLFLFLSKDTGNKKIVFIDIGKMQEAYKFKKDIEATGSQNLYKIQHSIDSLKMIYKAAPSRSLDSQIAYAQKAFEQYYTYTNQDITKKVWDRLNPLLEEFGKEKKYELVIGANGAGTVLYGNTKQDVTAEAIQFINTKYEKGL